MEAFIERSVAEIGRRVGPDERVVCGLSGGVDSAVCAALLAKALGPAGRLRLRRQRACCGAASGRRSPRRSAAHSTAELRVVDAVGAVPRGPRRA